MGIRLFQAWVVLSWCLMIPLLVAVALVLLLISTAWNDATQAPYLPAYITVSILFAAPCVIVLVLALMAAWLASTRRWVAVVAISSIPWAAILVAILAVELMIRHH